MVGKSGKLTKTRKIGGKDGVTPRKLLQQKSANPTKDAPATVVAMQN